MIQRNDNVEGYVYLVEAVGVKNGLTRRVKIGLTRNVKRRLNEFESGQFPCDVKLLKAIAVSDMRRVEKVLHTKYKMFNIRFRKSREWFDVPLPVLFLIKQDMERMKAKDQDGGQVNWLAIAAIAMIVFASTASLTARNQQLQEQPKKSIVQY